MTQSNLLEAVREAARICGETALAHFRSALQVEWKADGSEVTRADREAELAVRAWIGERFPHDAIVGEEFGSVVSAGRRRWFIDPIDGTRSFVRGVPLWGSMVAVEEGGTVLAGAINCAASGDFVVAARGEGCWHNGVRASVSTVAALDKATLLGTDQRFLRNPQRLTRWTELCGRVAIARSWGDCYGYVLVATGRAEAMVDDRLNSWDVAALVPIIEEAGGVLTDWNGRRGMGADAVATNAALAEELRAALGVPEMKAASRTAP
jgi:histidinol phosphatase-like enzyme (inositol monophosphatase family)